jgi:geranylgeranyl diphosphate synthase type I
MRRPLGERISDVQMKNTLAVAEFEDFLLRDLASEANQINRIIQRELDGQPRELYEAAYYLPSIGGKRMRPYLTVKTGQFFGKTDELLRMAGVSVELLHNFTLVHDDIMDRDAIRRGMPTMHRKFGLATALLASDLLFSKSMELASNVEIRLGIRGIVGRLADTSVSVDEGQYLDMNFEKREIVSTADYLGMISLKTASMYECSTELGGIVGGIRDNKRVTATPSELPILKAFGRNLGLAFQIRDDFLGSFGNPRKTGKSVGNDIRRGKKTFVVLSAIERASLKQRDRIRAVLGKHRATDTEIRSVISLFRRLGVDKECSRLVDQFADRAVEAVSVFDHGKERRMLEHLAAFAACRES